MPDKPRTILFLAVSTAEQAKDEKASLEAQETTLREIAARDNWHIVDVLRVPGISRVYFNWYDFADAARELKCEAGYDLLKHWKARDFDILAVYEASRIGREQGIFSEAVGRTIDAGARLYSATEGYIDAENYRMFSTMAAYRVSTEIDILVKRNKYGMRKRAEKGLGSGTVPFFAHKLIRDSKGKACGVVLDESKQRLFDDLARLILQGVPMTLLSRELFKLGHVDPDTGKAYARISFYRRVHLPAWWGHTARGYEHYHAIPDLWAIGAEFEADYPPPPNIDIWRNTLPPVWTGDIAERIKAELLRRRTSIRGTAHSDTMNTFSGLVVCDTCGAAFIYHSENRRGKPGIENRYLQCSRHRKRVERGGEDCSNVASITDGALRQWMHDKLMLALAAGELSVFSDKPRNHDRQLELVQRDLEAVQKQITRLAAIIATASDDLIPDLQAQLETLNEKRRGLRRLEQRYQSEARQVETSTIQNALDDIRAAPLETFWQLSPNTINQTLHRLLGRKRLVVKAGKVLDGLYDPTS